MISLRNVSKIYTTKTKTQTQALKDVSLSVANSGMVFVLGKSGSGKSTLLNLLGGLDAPTSGEIFVDGVSMQQFSQRDYDTYRNNYVGFIFQEFNLLADFNVRDNVSLALKLSKSDNVDEKVTDALRQVELNEDYLNRRIDEMSGGEKQRIAIARAIIKDSKIILADEPTGNLDSATGESIWNILKNLSRDRLVVVVSHDRESAEKYADRIIEIADGQIVADNGSIPTQEVAKQKEFVAVKQGLSFGARLKMAYNTLRLRKSKTVSVILLAIFSILSVLIMQMCLSCSAELTLAKYITQNNVDYVTVAQGSIRGDDNMFQAQRTIPKSSTKEYIANNSRSIKDGLIESKQDILDFGLTFVGNALELDDHSYYATTEAIEWHYNSGLAKVEVNGELVGLVRELHPIDFLIGKKVYLNGMDESMDCILAGVIDVETVIKAQAFPTYFCNENFTGRDLSTSETFNFSDPKNVYLQLSNTKYDGEIRITDYARRFLLDNYGVIVTAEGIVSSFGNLDVELADNEIILPYELYAKFFDVSSKWYYINNELTEVRNTPQEIGQTFALKFYDHDTGELLVDCGEVKLAGVAFTRDSWTNSVSSCIALGEKLASKICAELYPSMFVVQVSSVKNIGAFLYTLRREYNGFVYDVGSVGVISQNSKSISGMSISERVYTFEETIRLLSFIFLTIGAVLLIVLVLLVINLISFSIANRKKEMGILSALGASSGDVTSIFLLETLIISTISCVIILALVFIFGWVFNRVLSSIYQLNVVIPFVRVDIATIAILVGTAFGLLLLAALIPIRKIIKLKPVDAIRNN